MGHTHESFDTDGALIADTTVTAGTGITATTGAIAATAGAVTAGTDVTATRSVTGAALYTSVAPTGLARASFKADGTNPPTFDYIRLYDFAYGVYRDLRCWNGALVI
jgi:hypothetical protein